MLVTINTSLISRAVNTGALTLSTSSGKLNDFYSYHGTLLTRNQTQQDFLDGIELNSIDTGWC